VPDDAGNIEWGAIARQWVITIVAAAVVIVLLRTLTASPSTKRFIHKSILRAPKFGVLVNKVYSARFANTLAILYASGLSLLTGIHLSSKVVGNVYLEQRLTVIMDEISEGNSLSDSLAAEKILDPLLSSMVRIGEETGSLDSILNSISDYYDQETDAAITKMLGLIEPLMLVIMAGVIGVILVSVMVPIFQLYQQIG
jgi:type IV pilus assembly protein PilC